MAVPTDAEESPIQQRDKYLIARSDYARAATMPSVFTCSHQNKECRNNMSDYCAWGLGWRCFKLRRDGTMAGVELVSTKHKANEDTRPHRSSVWP